MENLILGEGLLCESVVVAEQMGSEILHSDFGEQSCSKDEELVVPNVGESSVPDRSPGFYRDDNAGCVISDEVNESGSVERDGLVGGDDNVSVLEEEECLNSEYGIGGCGIGGCSNAESSEMKLKEGWCRSEDDGFDPGNGVQQDELRDDLSVDPRLSSEGAVNVKDEQGDLPSEFVDMDACGDYSVFSVNSLEAASVKGVVLTGIEAAALSNRISPEQDGEMPLEVALQSVSPGNGIQRDEQRDDLSVDVTDVKEEQGDLPSELVDMVDYSVFSVNSLEAASEKGVVLSGIEATGLSNRISLAHDGEMFPEVVHTGDMVSNCNWKNDDIDDNGVGRVKDDLCNGKTTEVFDTFDQILLRREKQDFGKTFEDLPMSASPSSSVQLKDLRSNNVIDCSLVDRATEFIEEKSNVVADVQAEIDNRISTIGFNVSYLKEGSSDVAANCIIENSISLQSCDAFSIFNSSDNGVYADSVPEVAEMKSNIDPCNQTLPPEEKHTRDFEGSYVSDSPSVCTLESDQKSVELIGYPSSETVNECLEQIVLKEDKSSNLNEGSSGLPPHNTIEEAVSLQLYKPLDNGINGSSKRVDVQDTNDSPGHVESSTLYDHSGQIDHEGNDSFGVDCVYHTKFSTIIALSAQRSGRSRKTQTKKSPRKRRNTSKVLQPLAESVFKGAARKRSCLSKPPRSSTWGLLGSVTQSFEESNGLEVFQVFQDQKEGSQKRRGSRRGEKHIHTGETVNSQVSRGTKTNPLRLKVKFGKEVDKSSLCINVPEVVNASASANSVQELNVIEGNWRQEATIKKCQPTSKIPFQDEELAKKDVGGVFVSENSAENEIEIGHGVTSLATAASSGGSAGSSYRDPGTSPDSEVINLVPEAHVEAKPEEDSHDTVLVSDKVMSALVDLTSSKREKKKHKSPYPGNCVQEDGSPSMMKLEPSTNQDGCRQNVRRDIFSSETFTQSPGAKAVSNSSSDAEFSVEPQCLSEETDIIISKEVLKVERGPEAETDCNLDVGLSSSKSPTFKNMLPSSKKKGQKPPKGKSRASDCASKRSNARKPRENNQKSLSKKKVKDDKQLACKVESPHDSGDPLVDGVGNGNSAHDAVLKLDVVPADIDKQYLPPRQAWVLCDACNKWRQIPADLADYIDETKCTWTCQLNEDVKFADCSIPQEKSNAEINAELEISEASGEEDASDRQLHYKTLEYRRPSVSQQHVSSIKTNQFLHRNRKNQSIDEIMVCHCKPPSNGKMGCGDDCLNRMLNIECVRGTCPCGDLCSNQQFQKRRYAKLEKFPSGKKGFGLRSLDHIFEGQFLIEYVGEVLDTHAYEARLKEYAVKGHRHFYFMTLNTSEVIDACAKGNLGRFINHSCDPNCRTEKWMVNGEVCIGLFALRDIKKGEEVTFDYNFVRVIGAAAKKCHCGSPHCQGFIGGDPLNTEVTIQDDSDEEYVEPVMIPEDGLSEDSKSNMGLGDGFDDSGIVKHEEIVSTNKELDKSIISVGDLETTTQIEESGNQYTLELEHLKPPSSVQSVEAFGEKETISEKSSNSFERPEITSPRKISIPISDGVDAKKQFKVDTIHRNVKTSRLSSSVKKGKVRSTPLSTNKIQVLANKAHLLPFKPKRSIEGSVEEKLNELLDVDGGISKRKDSTKGYLKLLFLTAQSGDSGSGEAIKSNRDLSIILDALVKTRSRAVLVDIINKNGLRMLHNIMKMCRRDFNKIPILRKLLKVLEYLAEKPQILTQEHITGGPPCPGMESFTESILSLTEHDDKTVHQIARNFRNKWIPRAFRRHNFVDRDDRNRGSNYNRFSTSHDNWHDQSGRSTEVVECVKQSGVNTLPSASTGLQEGSSTPSAGSCPSSVTKVRKRKSRWDQPAETVSDPISLPNKEQKMEPGLNTQLESNGLPQAGDVTLHPEANLAFDGKQNNLEDVPPGFSSCHNTPVVSSVASSPSSVMGSPQAKFVSRLPVSYGIPLSIVQQYGTAHTETADTWVVAPGMPFRPFPPLPPGPRPKEDASHSHDVNLVSVNHSSEGQQASFVPGNCQSEESTRSTTSATQVDFDMASANNDLCSKRQREFSYESPMGRRYFKQQKWNHPKPRPPWIRDRNGWGCSGNNFRGGTNSIGVGNVPNELRTPAGNNVDQHSQHH